MKKNMYYFAVVLLLGIAIPTQAQVSARQGRNRDADRGGERGTMAKATVSSGKTYYVSPNGSVRADGLSKDTPLKDLQKAIDLAEEGSTILVAEGNYLGNMDRGYIECGRFGNGADDGKFLKFYGGYSLDFSERDPVKYITKIQPNEKSPRSIGSALFHITARRAYGDKRPAGEVVVDGFTFDGGGIYPILQARRE